MSEDKRTAVERLKAIDPRGIAGSACLWAWVDTMYKSGFFAPMQAQGNMAEVAVWATFLLVVPLSVLVLVGRRRIPSLAGRTWFVLCAGLLGSLGSVLFVLAASCGSMLLLAAGSVLCAVFMGFAILFWGAVYCRDGERSATIYVSGGFAVALLFDITFMLMESTASALIPATLPLLCMAFFAFMPREARVYAASREVPASKAALFDGDSPKVGLGGRVRLALGVSVPSVCSLALIMFGLGYMQHQMSFSTVPGAIPDMGVALQVTRGAIAAILFMLAICAPRYTHVAYRIGLLAIIAGFSLMPLLAQSDAFWISGAVVLGGYTTFDVLIWVIVAQSAYAGMSDGATVTCVVRMLISSLFCGLGGVCAIAADGLAASVPFAYADSIFVGYLMTIAAVLVLSGRDVWELFDARPAAPAVAGDAQVSPDAALDALAADWGLTEREREVFGYLAVGRTQPWVAERLSISESTVNSHVRHIYGKAGVNSRQGLLDLVFRAQSPKPVDTAD